MKNKYILVIFFAIVFLFCNSGFANALEIKNYPPVPGLIAPQSNCTGNDCLSIYIAYWFGLLVYIAAILALISFTIGAVGLINPNIESHNDAKDRMKGSILGLALTLIAFVILKTINPTLVTPSITPLPGVAGVFYYNGTDRKPVGLAVSDVKNRGEELVKNGFDKLIYDCTDESMAPALLVWEFPQTGLEGGNDLTKVKVARKTCGQQEPIGSYGSFKMDFETPGVYYCLGECGGDNMCSGYMSSWVTSDDGNISDTFNGKIKSVRIVNNAGEGLYYGAILHETIGLENGGGCTYPIINNGEGPKCYSKDSEGKAISEIGVSAANIFTVNNAASAGDGVDFYSEPFGDTGVKGLNAGFYNVKDEKINPVFKEDADKICFDYKNVNMPDTYKYKCSDSKCGEGGGGGYACENNGDCYDVGGVCEDGTCKGFGGEDLCSDTACETLKDCPGSINIKGSYLVGVYSEDLAGGLYCQTFTENVPDLNAKNIIEPGSESIGSVYIIPTE